MIHQVNGNLELSPNQVRGAATMLLDHCAPDWQKEQLLEALAKKGETPAEIAGFVTTFLEHAVNPQLDLTSMPGPSIDMCGTGGGQLDLINVSSTAMFIVAAAGAVVVKHGNRAITSRSGGADVLEALGIRIDLPVDGLRRCIETTGLGFLFAPLYHPAFKAVAGVRNSLGKRGVKTIFNLIGPLLNPLKPSYQLVGVYSKKHCAIFAEILHRLGRRSAWVVNGSTADRHHFDEVSLMGPTRICKSGTDQQREECIIRPESFGFKQAEIKDLQGGDAKTNAAILEAILSGKETGPKRDIVLLNAAAALACTRIANDIAHGVEISKEMIRSGAALEKLRLLRKAAS